MAVATCTKPALEAEILVPTIVKLSNRCQSDKNHLVPTKKHEFLTNISAGAKKNMNLPETARPAAKNHESPSLLQKMLNKNPF